MKVAIAGAGMAGLATAAFLARAGHDVDVFDKAPAPSPVGSGLIVQPTGQAVLRDLGLLDDLKSLGARLDRLDGRTQGGVRRILNVRYDALGPDVYGISVHRSALFELLHRAAREAGAQLHYQRDVSGFDDDGVTMRLNFSGRAVSGEFDLIVDALGVKTPFVERKRNYLNYGALWANVPFRAGDGFSENILTQRYRGSGISSGVMPIGRTQPKGEPMAAFFWTLRADQFPTWRASPLSQWKEKALALWPELAPLMPHFTSHDQFVFAHYAHHTAPAAVEGRLVHIGDAWHAASPQLGQGANMALLDARALSSALNNAGSIDDALMAFVKLRRRHVQLYQLVSFLFTPVYQSDSKILPALRDILAEPLSNFWFMPRVFASLVTGAFPGGIFASQIKTAKVA